MSEIGEDSRENNALPKAKRVFVASVGFDVMRMSEALNFVADFFARNELNKKFLLVTPNPEIVLAARADTEFRTILNGANLSVADGIGILWAAYFLSLPHRNLATLFLSLCAIIFAPQKIRSVLPERVTGTDLFPELLRLAARLHEKVFLLGAAPGVAEKVRERFTREIPGLAIVGTFAGSPSAGEEEMIRTKINVSGATLLFVAYGAPAQEKWLARNLPYLPHVKFAAGIGGAFDFYAGTLPRAPRIFRTLGLEWVWRLSRQPKRLPRIWNATFRFVRLVWSIRGARN